MYEQILENVRLMRKAGVEVAPSELEDCFHAFKLVPPSQYDGVIRATLLKDPYKRQLWYKLSRLTGTEACTANSSNSRWARMSGGLGKPGGGGAGGEELINLLNSASFSQVSNSVRETVDACYPALTGSLPEKIAQVKRHFAWYMVQRKAEMLRENGGITEDQFFQVMNNLTIIEEEMELAIIKRQMAQDGPPHVLEYITRHWNVREKCWNDLSNWEIQQIRQMVKKLGKKLAVRYSRRIRPGCNRYILLRQTFYRSLKYHGIPIKLVKGRPRKEKPRLVVLCDVSRSVVPFADFMLTLTHAIQTRHKHVRSFIFVDYPVEVTDLFQKQPLEKALEIAKNNTLFSWSGFSDFGTVFSRLTRNIYRLDAPKSHLIIVADGKNNWKDPQLDSFRRLAHGFRKVWWFNPLEKDRWQKDDCIMKEYLPFIDRAVSVPNYLALSQIVYRLM